MHQHGIFRKTPRFRYTWFSRPGRLFDAWSSTPQYSLQPGGLFDLVAKEYQRPHPNLTPILCVLCVHRVFEDWNLDDPPAIDPGDLSGYRRVRDECKGKVGPPFRMGLPTRYQLY